MAHIELGGEEHRAEKLFPRSRARPKKQELAVCAANFVNYEPAILYDAK
jgi:hypothetical protein